MWAPIVFKDLALASHLTGRIDLYDIDPAGARYNVKVANGIFAHRRSKTTFKTRAVSRIESALKGADFDLHILTLPPCAQRESSFGLRHL